MSLATRPVRRLVRRRRHHERRRPPLRRVVFLLLAQLALTQLACAVTAVTSALPAVGEERAASTRPPDRRPTVHGPRRPGRRPARVAACPVHPATPAPQTRTSATRTAVARGLRARLLPRPVTGAPGRSGQEGPSGPRPGAHVSYVPPVAAEVTDPFRPPLVPWGPGNRGLEYDTDPGDAVWASADGVVTFAGRVGGMRHVTIQHADGLRTGYSFLAEVSVARGQAVRQGDPVGRAGDTFHFGARVGTAYVDPAALFDAGATVVELLPYEVPPGGRPAPAARLVDRAFGRDDVPAGGEGRSGLVAAYDWLRDRAEGAASALGRTPPGRAIGFALDLGDRVLFPGPCSHGPPPVAPAARGDRVAITVAGLGSSSDGAAIAGLRTAELGYDHDRVLRFSYAGGVVPATAPAGVRFGVEAHAYGSADTQGDLREAADRLADLVEQVLARDPGVAVDLYAHSQGGLVTRLALTRLTRRGVGLDRVGLVATLASPHRGADLASGLRLVGGKPSGSLALDLGRAATRTSVDPDAVSVAQLAEGSGVVAELGATGVPEGVQLVSIAARGDLVVASPNTEVEGATNVTVPVSGLHAHSDVVASDAATGELARALAREPPACEGPADAAGDVLAGHTISATEDALGALAFTLAP